MHDLTNVALRVRPRQVLHVEDAFPDKALHDGSDCQILHAAIAGFFLSAKGRQLGEGFGSAPTPRRGSSRRGALLAGTYTGSE